MNKLKLAAAVLAALATLPVTLVARADDSPADPSAWGSYRGLRVPSSGSEFRLPRSLLSAEPKSSFTVDAAGANNEGGMLRFHYSPSFRDAAKESSLKAAQSAVGGRSGFSLYGQLGDPRFGLKGVDGVAGLVPSDRPGGFILDPQRDFRRNPGVSLGVGYDF
ncbi:MAG: hypothetical protein U1E63_09975 [Burkholderiales bacterium]